VCRFKVKYLSAKDGKTRYTQVSAGGKIKAAEIVLSTLAKRVLSVEVLREKKK
jgi:hypothetical protein